ncbi:MAG TPA: S-methyl-5'-thioadenosine phosphorylase [Candidatus Omnitrophota bacterium]|nr:S-methyl-5'-thioadenosine phosphorylase [Candidatus Omnitrophota bacterium]
MAKIGIIGGSGLYQLEGLENVEELVFMDTPFGPPSDHFMSGKLEGVDVVFLSRHGRGHRHSPSTINYRANIYEMKRLGVEAIFSVSACGSLKEDLKPMDFVVPDQFVDRTNHARQSSFFTDGIVAHVAFAEPVSPELTKILIESCKTIGVPVHEKGTYVNMEGPQFSTKAESNLYRSWGMDIIGMTNMTEAKLAREAEIAYATLAAVTDYDCWYEGHESVTVEVIIANLMKNIDNAKKVLRVAIPKAGRLSSFSAQGALKHAIMTDPKLIPEQTKSNLRPIIGKYIR